MAAPSSSVDAMLILPALAALLPAMRSACPCWLSRRARSPPLAITVKASSSALAVVSWSILSAVGESTSTRSEEHTSELQSLMRISYAVFCLKNKNTNTKKSNEVGLVNHNTQNQTQDITHH